MTIKEAIFHSPLHLNQETNMMVQIQRSLHLAEIRPISPGQHDVTPKEWRDPNFQYTIHVNPNGTGVLHMEPRHSDSLAFDPRDKNMPAAHAIDKPLNEHSKIVVIAGGYKPSPTGLACFRLVWFKPESQTK